MHRRSEPERGTGSSDQVGIARIRQIQWSHPRLRRLSDPARLVYACLVDGCSSTARETLDSVELVWQSRSKARSMPGAAPELRYALDEICRAVDELIVSGLLVLLDGRSIFGGWVMKPWETRPS